VLQDLDGEGIFGFFHPRLQVLDFSPLVFQEEVFDAVQPDLALLMSSLLAVAVKPSLIISARSRWSFSFVPYVFKHSRLTRGINGGVWREGQIEESVGKRPCTRSRHDGERRVRGRPAGRLPGLAAACQ
jgi:hypothetical protein